MIPAPAKTHARPARMYRNKGRTGLQTKPPNAYHRPRVDCCPFWASALDDTRTLALQMKMPFRIPHGFTLVELLVVVAVIAVLASLLLPAVSRAKQAAHSAVCKSNLRQYGQAVQMYLNDFHVYPPYAMRNSAAEKALWWRDRVREYTAAKPIGAIYQPASASGIELCPSYDRAPGWQGRGGGFGSYGYNYAGITRNLNGSDESCGLGGDRLVRKQPPDILPDDIRLVGENEVASPGEMVLLADSLILGGPEGARFLGLDDCTPAYFGLCAVMLELRMGDWRSYDYDVWRYALKGITRRHVGRWNVVFCDGHVEDLTTKQLFDLRQENICQRWNRDNLPHKEKLPTSFR